MGFIAFLLILATAVAVQVAGGEEHLELQECSSSTAVTQLRPMVHPPVPETSVTLVRELMDPFSLQDFAETFWERKPMVIRGRSPNHYDRLVEFGLGDVESVIEKGVSLSGEGEEPMVLGSDWNIIKRVFVQADGEFWTAGLPPSALAADKQGTRSSSSSSSSSPASGATDGPGSNVPPAPGKTHAGGADRVVSLEEARKAFHRGGFSVVINRLQRRWRGVLRASRALEHVLGQPVNANLYMTPPQSQGFEAHFDWMDGIVVQLTGSKTWILYHEMVTMPRPDLKFKPKAAELGEPIAVLDLYPGDMMYIPRGWPHEAAVNGTAARPGGGRGASPSSSTARGPSLHVTFGVETALSGTYESLLHHALEVAAVEHPLLFGLLPGGGEESDKRSANDSDEDNQGRMGGDAEIPWLQLLHLWVHDVASRDARLRKAVPLAPLFFASSEGRPAPATAAKDNSDAGSIDDDNINVAGGRREGVCTASAQRQEHQTVAPSAVLQEFKISLEACAGSAAADDAPGVGGAASSTLALLDSLLDTEQLYRVREMFFVGDGELRGHGGGDSSGGYAAAAAAAQRGGEDEDAFEAVLSSRMSEETEWSRATLEAFDRTRFSSSSLREKMEGFRKVASPEGALRRMVVASSRRARERDEITERDLARCGQGPPNRGGVAV